MEKSADKILYPAYFTYIGGEAVGIVGYFTPINAYLSLVAVIPGHIVGRIKAGQVETEGDQCSLNETPTPTPEAAAPPENRLKR